MRKGINVLNVLTVAIIVLLILGVVGDRIDSAWGYDWYVEFEVER